MNFSFIIPVYNCRAYLKACVESILSADISSREILLIDDGSTDGSEMLCDTLACRYPEIRVLHQENAGAASARNAGLRIASGKWILFADADDTLDPRLLDRVLSNEWSPETDLTIYGMTFDYYRRGICYRRDLLSYGRDAILSQTEWAEQLYDLYQHNLLSPLWNKIFRGSILRQYRMELNPSLFVYEDLEFVLRYLACCKDVQVLSAPVYHYRHSEDEGNAKRRLKKAGNIPPLIRPIADSLDCLRMRHTDIFRSSRDNMLQHLHLTLAREKIAVSDCNSIRSICRDYAAWEHQWISQPAPSKLRNNLIYGRIAALWVRRNLGAIRHRIAVSVKLLLYCIRSKIPI